jgi:hypothetical protein
MTYKIKISLVKPMIMQWSDNFKMFDPIECTSLITCIAVRVGAHHSNVVLYIQPECINLNEEFFIQGHFLIFLYFFYHDFAQIYGPLEILQNYTSAVVAHDVRDIMPWPTMLGATNTGPLAWGRHSAVSHDVRNIAAWAATLCPSAMGHDDSRPASAVAHDPRIWLPI